MLALALGVCGQPGGKGASCSITTLREHGWHSTSSTPATVGASRDPDPEVWVVYQDWQAYPEYVVTFTSCRASRTPRTPGAALKSATKKTKQAFHTAAASVRRLSGGSRHPLAELSAAATAATPTTAV